jgi:serine/threonine protein kinase
MLQKEELNPHFAVKKLHSDLETLAKDEVTACAKAGGADGHHHLIRLLATWQRDRQWYLLFPWSDYNLRSYWEKHKPAQRDLSTVQWIAKQCLGMVGGLNKIHRTHSPDPRPVEDLSGIHGDIKPENILWFTDSYDEKGILVICDYGFTQFHSKASRSNAIPAGNSETYRAPEHDTGSTVSRACDLWSIGCVCLEFITWYLTGYAGFDEFSIRRTEDGVKQGVKLVGADDYFLVVDGSAILKPSVLKASFHVIQL